MNDFTELTKNIATTEDLNLILADITKAESFSYNSRVKHLSKALKGGVSGVFEEFLEKLDLDGKVPSSENEKAAYFSSLKSNLGKLPKMEIELAFSPDKSFIKKIVDFVREATNTEVILDINVKPNILAGVTIGYKGKFKDYSFSAKLDEVLKQKYAKRIHESI